MPETTITVGAAGVTHPAAIPQGIIMQTQIPPIDTSYCLIPIWRIVRSSFNPREMFDDAYLAELAVSIKQNGLIHPITVRPIGAEQFSIVGERAYRDGRMVGGFAIHQRGADGKGRFIDWHPTRKEAEEGIPLFEIVAGECRWRASKLAGLQDIQALVRQLDDEKARTFAVIENLQRKELDPFEEARGFRLLMDLGYSQRRIMDEVGCSQGKVSKTLNLVRLPADVQTMIREKRLTPSHGERLVRFADYPALCSAIAEKAVAQQTPATDLDGKNVPWAYDMEQKKLIKQLYMSSTPFDSAICRKCPFGAFRPGSSGNYGVCLKPAHYNELEKEVVDKRQETLRAAQEAMRREAAQIEEAAAFGDIPAVNGNPAVAQKAAAIKHLPTIKSLKYGTYEDLGKEYAHVPAGCTADCPCRAAALGNRDGQENVAIPICSNPERFKKLQDAQSRADKKTARVAFAEREKAAQEIIAPHTRSGDAYVSPATHRIAVIAVWDSLLSAGKNAVEPAAKRLGIALDFSLWGKHVHDDYKERPMLWDALEKLQIGELLQLTVEACLAREILQKFSYGNPRPTDKLSATDWITAAGSAAETERPIATEVPDVHSN